MCILLVLFLWKTPTNSPHNINPPAHRRKENHYSPHLLFQERDMLPHSVKKKWHLYEHLAFNWHEEPFSVCVLL